MVRCIWRLLDRYEILNFMVVGGIGFLVNMGLYWSLLQIMKGTQATVLGSHYYLPPFLISGFFIICLNYWLNKVWTFRGKGERSGGFIRYLGIAYITGIVDIVLLWVFVDYGHLYPLIAAGCAVLCAFGMRYAVARRFVWRKA